MGKKYPILYESSSIKLGFLNSKEEILYLFDRIFNRQFTEEILDWYAACPTGSNLWYGAFYQDNPIGMYGLLPMKFKINDQIYEGALCNNVGVVPEFQAGFRQIVSDDNAQDKKSLFEFLGEYALKDSNFPIVVAAPNTKAVEGHKSIGWKNYGTLELLHGTIEEKSSNDFIKNILNYDSFITLPPQNSFKFSVVKSLDWVKWRYSKPGVQYQQSISNNQRYLIWKSYQEKKQVLETNDVNLVFQLDDQVDIWQFKGSTNSESLKTRGFVPILSNEFIVYRNQEINLDFSIDLFNFELGDNDVF